MSSIYKLSICGVRSFDPERSETIQFGFPLTLICGQNGCGKTTIIECLKYATTGDLPPNSKGGAFVHDPKLVFKSEVRAQVKLAFSNANGKSMICTRSMQLAKKRGASNKQGDNSTTFKTLEGQLAIMNKGERSTISTKNAELDTQIPLYLGASKAILDYVIFCHQDDSLWPLSEASILKKRFDDIFEASKFTKVLDNLKSIRKDMTLEIKLIEQSVEHFKIDKERSKKINAKLQDMKDNIAAYSDDIASLTAKLEKYETKAEKLFQSNQEFQEVLSKLDSLKTQQKSNRDQIARLNLSMEVLPDTDEELIDQLSNFEDIIEEKRKGQSSLKAKLSNVISSLESTRNDYNKEIRLEATLRGKEEAYKKNVDLKSEIIKENSALISGNDGDVFSTDGEDFRLRLEDMLAQSTSKLEQTKSHNQKQENSLIEEIKQIDNSVITFEQQIKNFQSNIKESEAIIEESNRKIEQLQYGEGNLEVAKSELQNNLDKLDKEKKKNQLYEFQAKANEGESEIAKLELEIEGLNKKIGNANKTSDLHAKLSLLKENKEQKLSSVKKLISFHKDNFLKETGEVLKGDGDESKVTTGVQNLEKEAKEISSLIDSTKEEYSSLDANHKADESKMAELKANEKKLQVRIFDIIDEDQLGSYEDLIADLESDYRDSLDALNTVEVTKQFNIRAIQIAEKENYCTLCYHPFSSKELTTFVNLLKEKVEKVSSIEKLNEECKSSKNDLESAKSINSDVLQYRKCLQDIDDLKLTLKVKEPKVLLAKEEYEKNLANFNEVKLKLAKLTTLQRPLSDIQRIFNDIKVYDKQIQEFEEIINDDNNTQSESPLSISELQSIQQQKNQEIKNIRSKNAELMDAKYSKQKELSRLESTIKDKQLAISDLEKSLLGKTNLETSVENHKLKVEKLNSELQNVDFELIEVSEKQAVKTSELAALQKENRVNESKLQVENANLDSLSRKFTTLDTEVKSYLANDSKLLETCSSKVIELENSIKQFEGEIQSLELDTKEIERMISESSNVKANIRTNLDLRNLQSESEEIESKIRELDVANAEGQKEAYQEESRKLRNLIAEVNAQHAGKIGEVRQMEGQIKSLKQELESEYKDIDRIYHEEWVKLQTNMLISNDLQTYSKALDNAIMKYHSIKMEEINRIVDELWKQTYKGSDVDTIAIKSDVNLQAKGNRSYNYRVVMYKSGTELDMRGRCSAGQKVLASIIIRLALAECFGINCGMIALDEPTTNLDVENIESLAEALNNIIEVRKKQKNFQLIVITHDEKFLSHINGDKFTDHFYRVQRDDLQRSTIRSLPISLIQEE